MTPTSKHRRRSFLWLAVLALVSFGGCAYRVAVTHLMRRDASFDPALLSHVYLVIQRPAPPTLDTSFVRPLKAEPDAPLEMDLDLLARRFSARLRERGGSLVAYRVQTAENDPFVALLKPSMVLRLTVESPEIDEKESVDHDVHRWTLQAQLRIRSELLSSNGQPPIVGGPATASTSASFKDPAGDHRSARSQDLLAPLMDAAAAKAADIAIPLDTVVRSRPLYAVEADTSSVAAMKAGGQERWEVAVPVWKKRLASDAPRWQDAWNLGVWAEKHQKLSPARAYFVKAKEAAAQDPKAPGPAVWAELERDFDLTVQPPTVAEDRIPAWFHQSFAVLPFTDESTSIDGPIHVRRLTRQALLRAGYPALPLQQVDKILKEQGLTQGGHLAAVSPAKLAKWLDVDFLLYGHLDTFDEVTLGIVGWKRVGGTMKVWSREKKDWLWQGEKRVSRAVAAKGTSWSDVGSSLLHQLAGSWSDKAGHQPMAAESAAYVDQQIAELPHKP